MKLYALGGGIAAGKSTVARAIVQAGVHVIDADVLARDAVAQGTPGFARILARWPQVVKGGVINRKALGAIVFEDYAARAELEAIVHPEVARIGQEKLERLEAWGFRLAFYETPLLLKSMETVKFDGIVVVHAPLEERIRRIMSRDNLTERQARFRIEAQPTQEDLLRVATWSIDTMSRAGSEAGAKRLVRILTAE